MPFMLLDKVPPPSQTTMSEAASRRIRAVFNVFNFWSIVLYNTLVLNSLDFAKLVAKRLFLKGNSYLNNLHTFIKAFCLKNASISLTFSGFPITTIIVMFVTYCLIQVIKETERRQALIDDPDPLPPPPTSTATPAGPPAAAAPQVVDPSKEKAE